jgi:hypothetical protein
MKKLFFAKIFTTSASAGAGWDEVKTESHEH